MLVVHSRLASWGIRLKPVDVGAVNPADTILVVGPSAIASSVMAFAEGSDLDWADQVVCVATTLRSPAARCGRRGAPQCHQGGSHDLHAGLIGHAEGHQVGQAAHHFG